MMSKIANAYISLNILPKAKLSRASTSGQEAPVLEYQQFDIFQPSREIDAIVDNKVYLGDLPGAMSSEMRESVGITHILTVCPHYPSTGPNHLQIPVRDAEDEDLLIYLPQACQFIQKAVDAGGRVLVHCLMGVSRSTTVTAAYLMWTRHWTVEESISFIRKRRPCVHPNYGFIRQLQAFAQCDYEPSPTNDAYLAWKRRSKRDIANYMSLLSDTTRISPFKIYLTSEFPKDPEQADLYLADMEFTHLLTLSPSQTTTIGLKHIHHLHIPVQNIEHASLLLALPNACEFIREATTRGGTVLVHCRAETRACIAIGAAIMSIDKKSPSEVSSILEETLPLWSPTSNFNLHLKLFQACNYIPTVDHPSVVEWTESLGPASSVSSSEVAALHKAALHILKGSDSPSRDGRESPHPPRTSFDLGAFHDTLTRIQKSSLSAGEYAET